MPPFDDKKHADSRPDNGGREDASAGIGAGGEAVEEMEGHGGFDREGKGQSQMRTPRERPAL